MRFYGYGISGRPLPSEGEIVRIGNAHGRIALYLDDVEAVDLAYHYGPSDTAYDELMQAVERAYPDSGPEDGVPHNQAAAKQADT